MFQSKSRPPVLTLSHCLDRSFPPPLLAVPDRPAVHTPRKAHAFTAAVHGDTVTGGQNDAAPRLGVVADQIGCATLCMFGPHPNNTAAILLPQGPAHPRMSGLVSFLGRENP